MENPFVEKKEDKNDKLIGGYVPLHIANYLRLFSIYQGKSLQSVLLDIITSWNTAEGLSPEYIMESLAQKAYTMWEKWEDKEKKDKTEYLKQIETTLSNLKLSDDYIEQVLELLAKKLSEESVGA